jgi:hypothetical protein
MSSSGALAPRAHRGGKLDSYSHLHCITSTLSMIPDRLSASGSIIPRLRSIIQDRVRGVISRLRGSAILGAAAMVTSGPSGGQLCLLTTVYTVIDVLRERRGTSTPAA